MPSKKYFIVKEEQDQNGGVYPIKIVNASPLILGAPIIKSRTFGPSTVSVVTIKSTSPKYEYELKLPYNIIRPFVNDLYRYKYYRYPSNVMPRVGPGIVPGIAVPSIRTSNLYSPRLSRSNVVAVSTASPTYSVQSRKMMLPSKYGYPYSEVKDVQVIVQTPQFTRTIYLGHANLLRVFNRMNRYYVAKPIVINRVTGITVPVTSLLSDLGGLLRNVISEKEYDDIYRPIQMPQVQ